MRMNTQIDVRDVLPSIRVPTLVLHRSDDRDVKVEEGRYIAAQIPGARSSSCRATTTCSGAGDTDAILDEVEEFLTGVRAACPSPTGCSRRCCSPTSSARPSGPPSSATARWRELLARHHAIVRRELERFRGREVDTAGDGFLATFDGPARAIRCATRSATRARARARDPAGLHTGECELVGDKVARHRRPHRRARRGARRARRGARVGHREGSRRGSGIEFDDAASTS